MANNDQRVFVRTANRTRKMNLRPKLMRGGPRL